MKTIYLSGASADLAMCEAYRDKLIAQGWTITLDWMKKFRNMGATDHSFSVREQQHIARADLSGVRSAQVFWLILPETSLTIGAWVELGLLDA
jgi:hypothetical protein